MMRSFLAAINLNVTEMTVLPPRLTYVYAPNDASPLQSVVPYSYERETLPSNARREKVLSKNRAIFLNVIIWCTRHIFAMSFGA